MHGRVDRVARVVDDDVELAEPLDGAVHERVDRVDVAHVRRDADGLAAELLEMRLGLDAGVFLAAGDRDLGAGGDQALGHGAADAARATGDDGHPAGEVEQRAKPVPVQAAHRNVTGVGWRGEGPIS